MLITGKLVPERFNIRSYYERYGEGLSCACYRHDALTHKCIKTVELIVEESDWLPPVPRFAADEMVWLRIGFVDRTQQQCLGAAGAKLDGKRCVWAIRFDAAVALGFADHVERRDLCL